MKTNSKKETFSPALALSDALPVLFFACSTHTIGCRFQSPVFFAGALLCVWAGSGKVLWKFLIATAGRDIPVLTKQMRIVMPAGFLVMILSLIQGREKISFPGVGKALISVPSVFCFAPGIALLCVMGSLSRKFKLRDVKANRIAQSINILAQGLLLAGLLLIR